MFSRSKAGSFGFARSWRVRAAAGYCNQPSMNAVKPSLREERGLQEAIGSRRLGVRDGGRIRRPAELREQLVGLGLLGKRGIEQRHRVIVAELLRP